MIFASFSYIFAREAAIFATFLYILEPFTMEGSRGSPNSPILSSVKQARPVYSRFFLFLGKKKRR